MAEAQLARGVFEEEVDRQHAEGALEDSRLNIEHLEPILEALRKEKDQDR